MLERRLIIVTGKGGVGRSAVASGIARARAARGERVLALAIDGGAGLAAHLGAPLSHEPAHVLAGLSAAVVDPASALDEYVRQRVGSMAPLALASRVFRVLAYTVPGVRDIVLIGKAYHEAARGEWDAVVVDATPAGQVQSTLAAPSTIAELVPRGSVHDQAAQVGAFLADPASTALVVVSTPEELALTEAAAVGAAADELGISPVRALILNRCLERADFAEVPADPGPRRDAAALHLDVWESQRRATASIPDAPRLPFVFGAHRPTDLSRLLAEELGRP